VKNVETDQPVRSTQTGLPVHGSFFPDKEKLKLIGLGFLLGAFVAAGSYIFMNSELKIAEQRISWLERQFALAKTVAETQKIFSQLTVPESLAGQFRALGYQIESMPDSLLEYGKNTD
jgi:hypothetical protein